MKEYIKQLLGRKELWRRISIAYAAILPLLVFIALEGINPAASAGLMGSPFRNMGIIVLSAMLIAGLVFLVFCACGSAFWSYVVVSLPLTVMYVVNYIKILITGRAFVPGDLRMVDGALAVGGSASIGVTVGLVVGVVILVLLHVPLWFSSKSVKVNRKLRICFLPVAMLMVYAVFVNGAISRRVMPVFGVQRNHYGSASVLYRDQGVLLGFHSIMFSRTGSGNGSVAQEFFANRERANNAFDNGARPNVIIIMSESFMDPTIIDGLEFSSDPVPNFRSLAEMHKSGMVVVPVYGGGTANTEFEFLTGNSIFFTGSAYDIPFMQPNRFFFRTIETALPWLFRHNGYRTVGLHPFYGDFFMRNHHYPLLGFDEFIAIEDMPDAVIRGDFVSDEYFTDRIIEQIKLAEAANEPLFLFGISMQNHWAFCWYKYYGYEQDVWAKSDVLNEQEIGRVDSLLQGLYDADKQLGRLIEFIESRDTPTLVVFFGDHLPLLGDHNDAIFEKLGYISSQPIFNWNAQDRQRMFQTPYLMWANYDVEWGEHEAISAYFLGALTAKYAGIELNRFYQYILHSLNYFRALTENHYVDINGVYHYLAGVRELPHIRAFESLQYSNLFGNDEFHRSLRRLE